MSPEAIEHLVSVAIQAETSKLAFIFGILFLVTVVPSLAATYVLSTRSRAKIAELQAQAAVSAQQAQDKLTIDQSSSINDAFGKLGGVLAQQHATIALMIGQREQDFQFHESYLELGRTRSDQLREIKTMLKDAGETQDTQNETLSDVKAELDSHVEATKPAIQTIQAMPDTLKRIEDGVKLLDEQVRAMPADLGQKLDALKLIVEGLKTETANLRGEVTSLANEVRRSGEGQKTPDPLAAPRKHPGEGP